MGREIKRVPLNFDHPLNEIWSGYLRPDSLAGLPCPDCTHGYSARAENLRALWYGHGHVPFDPTSTGSTPLQHDTPVVRAFAERSVSNSPDYYGTGEDAIVREAQRLARMWNHGWSHHLAQADVDALIEGGRLWDLTHTLVPGEGWQPKNPPVHPTAAEVNAWSVRSMGHDGINLSIVVRARCQREGVSYLCSTCDGHAGVEAYPGQRAQAEAWERTEPPEGDGWQLWETVTEGSPISPVCAKAEELAGWMSDPVRGEDWVPAAVAAGFIAEGWAPTGVASAATGPMSGVEFIGHHVADV